MPVALKGATSGDVTLTAASVAGATTITLPATTGEAVIDVATQTLTNKTLTSPTINSPTINTPTISSPSITGSVSPSLTIGAGTTSLAPIILTSGSFLTSATAGAVEFDGVRFVATPQSTQRGLITTPQYYRLNSGYVGQNVNTAQPYFGVGASVSASTVYTFEGLLPLTKTAGTTSHNLSLVFGGTATLNNIIVEIFHQSGSGGLGAFNNPTRGVVTSATASNITGAMTSASQYVSLSCRGTVSINAGGTFIPQYLLSAAPGGAYTTAAGAYFLIYPIGASGSNTSIGAWA